MKVGDVVHMPVCKISSSSHQKQEAKEWVRWEIWWEEIWNSLQVLTSNEKQTNNSTWQTKPGSLDSDKSLKEENPREERSEEGSQEIMRCRLGSKIQHKQNATEDTSQIEHGVVKWKGSMGEGWITFPNAEVLERKETRHDKVKDMKDRKRYGKSSKHRSLRDGDLREGVRGNRTMEKFNIRSRWPLAQRNWVRVCKIIKVQTGQGNRAGISMGGK